MLKEVSLSSDDRCIVAAVGEGQFLVTYNDLCRCSFYTFNLLVTPTQNYPTPPCSITTAPHRRGLVQALCISMPGEYAFADRPSLQYKVHRKEHSTHNIRGKGAIGKNSGGFPASYSVLQDFKV